MSQTWTLFFVFFSNVYIIGSILTDFSVTDISRSPRSINLHLPRKCQLPFINTISYSLSLSLSFSGVFMKREFKNHWGFKINISKRRTATNSEKSIGRVPFACDQPSPRNYWPTQPRMRKNEQKEVDEEGEFHRYWTDREFIIVIPFSSIYIYFRRIS